MYKNSCISVEFLRITTICIQENVNVTEDEAKHCKYFPISISIPTSAEGRDG